MTFFDAIIELKNTNQILGDIEFEQSSTTEKNSTLVEHSRDASIFQIMPQMVLFPKNNADIQLVLQTAQKHLDEKLSITVRAGGTCMSGGSLTSYLVLNMTRYMNSFEIDTANNTAIAEMGLMFKPLADEAIKHGLLFGAYTSSKDICGIGGMIGNNASGEKSIRLGATIDNVLGLEVILADGTLIRTGVLENTGESLKGLLTATEYKKELLVLHNQVAEDLRTAIGEVPKVASGYRLERIVQGGQVGNLEKPSPVHLQHVENIDADKDGVLSTGKILTDEHIQEVVHKQGAADLTPIFVGAQGTLGIVTRAMLQLKKDPTYTRLLVISVDSLGELPFILQTIMKHGPEGVETFDVNTFNRAKLLLKEETEVCEQFFTPTTGLVVLAQFSEPTQEDTDAVANHCLKALSVHPVRVVYVDTPKVQESIWKIRRSSFGVMRDFNAPGKHAVPCVEDIIVPISKFDQLIPGLIALIAKYKIEYGFHGHIGDGSIRIIPVFDFAGGSDAVAETIIAFTRDVISLVKSLKGNMSADHSDGIIRTPFLREFYGDKIFEAFARVKLLFDSNGILNRGKKVGGTEDAIKKYIIKG